MSTADDLAGAPAALDHPAEASPPPDWTADHVGERLVAAMRTLERLPRPKGPRAPGDHWPRHRVEWSDRLAEAELPEAERRERAARRLADLVRVPDGAALDRMDQALDWLRLLREEDPALALTATLWAWQLARRRSIRALCRERGWAPPTFHARRAKALTALADLLARRGVPVT